jgi:hypothetical protein
MDFEPFLVEFGLVKPLNLSLSDPKPSASCQNLATHLLDQIPILNPSQLFIFFLWENLSSLWVMKQPIVLMLKKIPN